ncbi:MAG: MerR family DNA-binding transcriptional regulator [Betaproteobacteria bacterium]|nr:MAG: MerR family DNA-binding transcriptional regulator [Betaproteobacteria bacterium]
MADITFTITDLAREFGLTTRAIRFYEDQGLLHPQRVGRSRVYANRDRVRLKLTLRGKRLGLSLSEIRELLDMYDAAKGGRGQLERFLEVLQKRRSALEQQREDIEAVLGEILSFEKQCHELLQKKREASAKKQTGNRDSEATV